MRYGSRSPGTPSTCDRQTHTQTHKTHTGHDRDGMDEGWSEASGAPAWRCVEGGCVHGLFSCSLTPPPHTQLTAAHQGSLKVIQSVCGECVCVLIVISPLFTHANATARTTKRLLLFPLTYLSPYLQAAQRRHPHNRQRSRESRSQGAGSTAVGTW